MESGKRLRYRQTLISILFLCGTAPINASDIPYPAQYRNWTHIKTLTLHKDHPLANPFAGMHHIYANNQALRDLKRDGDASRFNDGATLVFDLRESIEQPQATAEGQRVLLGLMTKDTKRYKATGGWGFEAWSFARDASASRAKRLVEDEGQSCFACHQSQQGNDFVFSQWRE